MGLYPTVRDALISTNARGGGEDQAKTPWVMFLAGVLSGGAGYGLSTPWWQIKTRLQASAGVVDSQSGLLRTGACVGQRPLFRNSLQALPIIWNEGGVRSLYRGLSALVVRGALMNAGNTLG